MRQLTRIGMICVLFILIYVPVHKTAAGFSSPSAEHCPRTVKITIKDFKYNDGKPVTINQGDSVIWFNADDMPHTASSDSSDQDFDTGILKPGEASEPIIFLKISDASGFAYSCGVHPRMQGALIVVAPPSSAAHGGPTAGCHHESPSEHSMVVLGRDPSNIFLHHVALFNDYNHTFHVTLEAKLADPAAQKAYKDYRDANGDSLVVLDPELFILTEIKSGQRTSFKAALKHLWKSAIKGLEDVQIDIVRIIQFRTYDLNENYPSRLTYQIFGNGSEAFLAHQVTGAPNFQQVVKLKEVPAFLTPSLLSSNPLLTVSNKQLAKSRPRVLRTAVLSNGTHVLLSPPVGTLRPVEPLAQDEELEVQIAGSPTIQKLTVGKLIYFDVRILNK